MRFLTTDVPHSFVRLSDALRTALGRLPATVGLVHYPLWTEWERVVGPQIALHARPLRLRRGLLVVEVDGPEWMQELRYLKRELRERLNATVTGAPVRDLFFVLVGSRGAR
jgi:predicted nucleic acid-binding Zn ribbon protein